ncbi:uncharacterized protein [Clytia hemisphaerica]
MTSTELLIYSDRIAYIVQEMLHNKTEMKMKLWQNLIDFVKIAISRRYALNNGFCITHSDELKLIKFEDCGCVNTREKDFVTIDSDTEYDTDEFETERPPSNQKDCLKLKSIKELKSLAKSMNLDTSQCIEKSELLDILSPAMNLSQNTFANVQNDFPATSNDDSNSSNDDSNDDSSTELPTYPNNEQSSNEIPEPKSESPGNHMKYNTNCLKLKSIKELKSLAKSMNLDTSQCIEKSDLVDILSPAMNLSQNTFANAQNDSPASSNGDSSDQSDPDSPESINRPSDNDFPSTEESNQKPRKRSTHKDSWSFCPTIEIDKLPYNIDGDCIYQLPFDAKKRMKSSTDGRPWDEWVTSNSVKHNGRRRRANCLGSPVCLNDECTFLKFYNKRNRIQFTKSNKRAMDAKCKVCGLVAVVIQCPAVKIWEFDEIQSKVTIKHTGKHTCEAINVSEVPEAVYTRFAANPERNIENNRHQRFTNSIL